MFCKKCGAELQDGAKFCNKCGEKQIKNKIDEKSESNLDENLKGAVSTAFFEKEQLPYKRFSFWFLILSIVILGIACINEGFGDENNDYDESSDVSIEDLQNFKDNCESISYDELARNPDLYEGNSYVFTGKISQVLEDTNITSYLINVTEGEYVWEDLVLGAKVKSDENSSRFLEDDIIRFYGVFQGLYTYETVLGSQNTVPYVKIYDIELV